MAHRELGRADPAAVEREAQAALDDFEALRRQDYTLARRGEYEKVVALWDGFLARHPEDGRAYLERGGALHHLRRMPEARADAQRSCELGVTEGCAILARLGGQPPRAR